VTGYVGVSQLLTLSNYDIFKDVHNLKFTFPKAARGLEPISYRGVLVSTLLHATVYVFYTIC
jgi:hypothetical protein